MFRQLAIFFGSAIVAQAHFQLDYPITRGFNEPNEVLFCGGFNNPSPSRTQFPLSGGIVTITSEHPKADILIGLSTLTNPTTFSDFNHTSNGAAYPFLVPFTVMSAEGDACFPVNASALDIPEIHNGANATIMVQFDGPDGILYQCADVVLLANATIPSSVKCDNATGAFPTSASSGNSGSNNTGTAMSLAVVSSSTMLIGFVVAALVSI